MNYRVAIIGAGAANSVTNSNLEGFSIGYSHARAYLAQTNADVVAIADIKPENAEALAQYVGGAETYTDYRDLLRAEKPDMVSVCTWPTLHCEMVLAAIESGVKMILCEKPMGVSLAEIDTMVDRAETTGTRLFVNHQRRYEQPYRGAKELIADGHIGELLRIDGFVGDGWDLMSWGSHWVDMTRYFNGDSSVDWVFAAAEVTGHSRYGHLIEDQMLLQLGFDNGSIGFVHTGPHTTGAGLIVVGSRGSLLLGAEEAHLANSRGDVEGLERRYLTRESDHDGFAAAIADVISSTESRTPSLIDARSGQIDTEIIMAAYQSAKDGAVQHLPLHDRSMDLRV